MNLSDQDLLLEISSHNEEAFKTLFTRHRDKLFAYIFKVTKSRETSEEIVMDVFMKLWQSRTVLTEIKNFDAFLFHVAKNKSLDFLRSAAKDRVLTELILDQMNNREGGHQPDERIILTELKSKINETIEQLSPQRQTVFRLSREQHMTYDEIASHLQLSKSTVKNHIFDSLHFIRRHISTHADFILLGITIFLKYSESY